MMLGDEGSGMDPATKGTGAEDMESSGSGYGPDDEDAQVSGKTTGKTSIDSDEEDDDIDGDDEEEDDLNVNEDFNKEKSQKPTQQLSTTTSTTSSTVRTPKNDDEESRYIDPVSNFNYSLICLLIIMKVNSISIKLDIFKSIYDYLYFLSSTFVQFSLYYR